MALVITLAMIVLLTVIILVFFTYATANRQIEATRADQTEADQLARSAGDYVIQQFLQEIVSNSTALTYSGGATVYQPISHTNSVPIRAVSSVIPATGTGTNFSNLIRQSLPASSGGVDVNASSDNTGVSSQNGRYVSTNQWNAPVLLSGAGFTATGQIPNWIYVNGSTGVTSTISSQTIGRFAYNVYDIGGLLDANVAGYASTEPTELPTPVKGSLSGAVLTNLPGVTQTAINTLVANFRNPKSAGIYTSSLTTNSSGSEPVIILQPGAVQTNAQQNGFLYPMATNSAGAAMLTNNFFLTRQDLIRYAQTTNAVLTNALPYLTTFSRTLNAPIWGPTLNAGTGANNGVNYNYLSNATNSASVNPFVPNVRFQSTATITHYNDDGTTNNYVVNPGDPLLQRRFSLAKLAWLTHTGPSTTAFNTSLSTAQINAAIQACFGLVWMPGYSLYDTGGIPPTVNGWEYVGPSATVQGSIETLGQVGYYSNASASLTDTTPREPNFFELLQAGILNGSLGQSYYQTASAYNFANNNLTKGGGWADNTNTYYQIVRIGANIIDQYKSDSYPTAIIFGQTGTANTPPATYTFWGMEDLPYLQNVVWTCYEPQMPNGLAQSYLIYQLWNPHQPSYNSQAGPSYFRVRVNANGQNRVTYVDTVPASTNSVEVFPYGNAWTGFPTNPVYFRIKFGTDRLNTGIPTNNFREPHVIRDNSPANGSFPGGAASYLGSGSSPFAIYCNALQLPYPPLTTNTITWTNQPAYGNNFDFNLMSTVIVLDYLDADGTSWCPYTTYIGHEESLGATGLGGVTGGSGLEIGQWAYNTTNAAYGAPTAAANPWYGFVKTDPRTFRFEAGKAQKFDTNLAPTTLASAVQGIGMDGWFNGPSAATEKPAYFAANTTNNGQYTYYPDNDNVVRPGDSGMNNGNPFQYNNYTYRPIILNRPFQSVAEMGYAFRDLPFKTLDFSSSSSADAGLLDLFCLNDEPAVGAGKVGLNSRQPLVQQSQLGLATNGFGVTGYWITNAASIASAYNNYAYNSGVPQTNISQTMADIPAFIGSSNYSMPPIKAYREAPVQALTGAVQSRTWNLLIDVIAQAGSCAIGAQATASNFVVTGEKHYWLSVAVDRYTGKVVDQQLEYVNE